MIDEVKEAQEGAEFEDSESEADPDAGKQSDGLTVAGDDELSRLAVAKALGMEKIHDLQKYSDQVQRLVEYAHLKGATDITGIISELNQLRNEVGMSKDVRNLSVYAGLAIEKARLEKEMNKWRKGN